MSKLQSVSTEARVSDLQFANKMLRDAVNTSSRGLVFRSGLFRWTNVDLVSITDASFGNEAEVVRNELKPHSSQKGRMTVLTELGSAEGDKLGRHIVSYSSSLIGRVCRATLEAEAHALSADVEEAVRVRAAIAHATEGLLSVCVRRGSPSR